MPGSGKRTNPVLFLASAILCLGAGFLVTQSSDEPSSITVSALPEVLSFAENFPGQNLSADRVELSDNSAESKEINPEELNSEELNSVELNSEEIVSEGVSSGDSVQPDLSSDSQKTAEGADNSSPEASNTSADGSSDTASDETSGEVSDEPSDVASEGTSTDSAEAAANSANSWFVHDFSPEASTGTWTYLDDHWYLVLSEGTYRGWLYDPDGHIYYFGPDDGIMKTGWNEIDGQIYYFDLDGIMQTGIHILDGTEYHFRPDGTLKGYINLTPTPAPDGGPEITGSSPDGPENNSAGNSSLENNSSGNSSPADSSPDQPEISAQPAQTAAVSTDGSLSVTKYVALTFDDGPSSYTDRLLDILEQNNARATFFMVGEEIQYHKELLPRMESLGCELGNHTWSHANLTELDFDGILEEIGRTNSLINEAVGHDATVIRPPYGAIDDNVRASLASPMILWSVDTLDWDSKDVESIIRTTFEEVREGSIILMHDIYETSVDAAEILIPEMKNIGYEFVTVHELAAMYGQTLHAGIAYGSMK